jgi:CheY-specific phosphatase CheX
MSNDQGKLALETTFISVVEKLTFMFGEQVDVSEVEAGDEVWMQARMEFSGDLPGALSVIVPEALQPEIAANILGLDAEGLDTREVLDDALREVLNVVCGHVIMALAGNDANFELDTPRNTELDGEQLAAVLAHEGTTAYLLDDEPVLLNLELW